MPVKRSPLASHQSESAYSNSSGTARGETPRKPLELGVGSSYAPSSAGSYAGCEPRTTANTTWSKNKWFSLPSRTRPAGPRGGREIRDWGVRTELVAGGVGEGCGIARVGD